MNLRAIGQRYNGTSPGKISIVYTYPGEYRSSNYESYDASSILKCLEYIENDGGRVVGFSIDPQPIPDDCCYIGWGSFVQLINHLYEKHFIDSRVVSYAKSVVPDRYKSYINSNDV